LVVPSTASKFQEVWGIKLSLPFLLHKIPNWPQLDTFPYPKPQKSIGYVVFAIAKPRPATAILPFTRAGCENIAVIRPWAPWPGRYFTNFFALKILAEGATAAFDMTFKRPEETVTVALEKVLLDVIVVGIPYTKSIWARG
jgi:hypothetical protein